MGNPPIKNSLVAAAIAARKAEKLQSGLLSLADLRPVAKSAAELSNIADQHQNISSTYSQDRYTPQEGQGADENRSVAQVVDRLANRAHAMDQVSVDENIPLDAEPLVPNELPEVSKKNPAKAGPRPIKAQARKDASLPERVAKRIDNLVNAHIERLTQTFGTSRFQGAVEMLRTDKMVKSSEFREIMKAFSGDKPATREAGLKALGLRGELLKTQKPKRQLDHEKRVTYAIKVRKQQIKEQKRLEKEGKAPSSNASSSGNQRSGARPGRDGNVARLVLKVE